MPTIPTAAPAVNAAWNPSVSAIAFAAPEAILSVVVEVAIADSAAIPSAPPTCCDVLMQPGREAGLRRLDAGEGGDRDRHEREAHPDRDHQEAGKQVGDVRAVRRDLREERDARGQERHPGHEHRLHADAGHELRRDGRPDDRRARDGEVGERRSSAASSRAPAACRA